MGQNWENCNTFANPRPTFASSCEGSRRSAMLWFPHLKQGQINHTVQKSSPKGQATSDPKPTRLGPPVRGGYKPLNTGIRYERRICYRLAARYGLRCRRRCTANSNRLGVSGGGGSDVAGGWGVGSRGSSPAASPTPPRRQHHHHPLAHYPPPPPCPLRAARCPAPPPSRRHLPTPPPKQHRRRSSPRQWRWWQRRRCHRL
ncbi:hypothetical protein I4F81_008161 [Pyropia yezoensis]|uniref:Uncharacterized protein n=1 Tax=Pyropia yezoensis TaxID=2788 RepID=A0ACC3C759_PYRYE|nr:hypothetical protein I4F81_008161 [Neopyropia yezoensis]